MFPHLDSKLIILNHKFLSAVILKNKKYKERKKEEEEDNINTFDEHLTSTPDSEQEDPCICGLEM